jgi:hypothetical protein
MILTEMRRTTSNKYIMQQELEKMYMELASQY